MMRATELLALSLDVLESRFELVSASLLGLERLQELRVLRRGDLHRLLAPLRLAATHLQRVDLRLKPVDLPLPAHQVVLLGDDVPLQLLQRSCQLVQLHP